MYPFLHIFVSNFVYSCSCLLWVCCLNLPAVVSVRVHISCCPVWPVVFSVSETETRNQSQFRVSPISRLTMLFHWSLIRICCGAGSNDRAIACQPILVSDVAPMWSCGERITHARTVVFVRLWQSMLLCRHCTTERSHWESDQDIDFLLLLFCLTVLSFPIPVSPLSLSLTLYDTFIPMRVKGCRSLCNAGRTRNIHVPDVPHFMCVCISSSV